MNRVSDTCTITSKLKDDKVTVGKLQMPAIHEVLFYMTILIEINKQYTASEKCFWIQYRTTVTYKSKSILVTRPVELNHVRIKGPLVENNNYTHVK